MGPLPTAFAQGLRKPSVTTTSVWSAPVWIAGHRPPLQPPWPCCQEESEFCEPAVMRRSERRLEATVQNQGADLPGDLGTGQVAAKGQTFLVFLLLPLPHPVAHHTL